MFKSTTDLSFTVGSPHSEKRKILSGCPGVKYGLFLPVAKASAGLPALRLSAARAQRAQGSTTEPPGLPAGVRDLCPVPWALPGPQGGCFLLLVGDKAARSQPPVPRTHDRGGSSQQGTGAQHV
jgi:hypothetical protein